MNNLEKYYNLTQLEEIAPGDTFFVKKMVNTFLEHTPELVDRIEKGIASENWLEVREASHKMKPSIDMMGIIKITQVIRELEANAKQQVNLNEIPALFATVSNVLEICFKQLKDDFFVE